MEKLPAEKGRYEGNAASFSSTCAGRSPATTCGTQGARMLSRPYWTVRMLTPPAIKKAERDDSNCARA
jgi:hypothetical protein